MGKFYPSGCPTEWCNSKATNRMHYRYPRLITQQVSNQSQAFRTKCCLIGKNQLCGHSTNYFTLNRQDESGLYFWMGLINSSLFNYVFNYANPTNNMPIGKLLEMRVPARYESVRAQVEGCCKKIIDAKRADIEADTSSLEAQIDQLVYKLYGLTDEEIAIVEGRGKTAAAQVESAAKPSRRRSTRPATAADSPRAEDDDELE